MKTVTLKTTDNQLAVTLFRKKCGTEEVNNS